jgi:uncharacterized membrane protein YoaT (DUF817 family)
LALYAATFLAIYGPCVIWFRPDEKHRFDAAGRLACCWSRSFIWFAENIGTYARAWSYPHQDGVNWQPGVYSKARIVVSPDDHQFRARRGSAPRGTAGTAGKA